MCLLEQGRPSSSFEFEARCHAVGDGHGLDNHAEGLPDSVVRVSWCATAAVRVRSGHHARIPLPSGAPHRPGNGRSTVSALPCSQHRTSSAWTAPGRNSSWGGSSWMGAAKRRLYGLVRMSSLQGLACDVGYHTAQAPAWLSSPRTGESLMMPQTSGLGLKCKAMSHCSGLRPFWPVLAGVPRHICRGGTYLRSFVPGPSGPPAGHFPLPRLLCNRIVYARQLHQEPRPAGRSTRISASAPVGLLPQMQKKTGLQTK